MEYCVNLFPPFSEGAFRNLKECADGTGWEQRRHDGRGPPGTGSTPEQREWRERVMQRLIAVHAGEAGAGAASVPCRQAGCGNTDPPRQHGGAVKGGPGLFRAGAVLLA